MLNKRNQAICFLMRGYSFDGNSFPERSNQERGLTK